MDFKLFCQKIKIMKLEKQVCSLKQAQKLYDLGVTQTSLFYHKVNEIQTVVTERQMKEWIEKFVPIRNIYYSAFTAAELGQLLPEYMESHSGPMDENWYCGFLESEEDEYFAMEDTEANAKAAMLIHLISNGDILEACNKRLLA